MKNIFSKFTRILLCSACVLSSFGTSVADPGVKLDVGGDINLTGTIKTNMQAGTEGQILQTQSDGSLQWVDTGTFENSKEFTNPNAPYTWTVPSGVTRIMLELWGGGGSGYEGGGGGSGGYIVGYWPWPVSAGEEFTIEVGRGGTDTLAAGITTVSKGVYWFKAYAGEDASLTGSGSGGAGGYSNTADTFQTIEGAHGYPTKLRYEQSGSTTYLTNYEYGDGGASPLRPLTAGRGGVRLVGVSGTVWFSLWRYGKAPGGGGGGYNTLTYGGIGKAIIYW